MFMLHTYCNSLVITANNYNIISKNKIFTFNRFKFILSVNFTCTHKKWSILKRVAFMLMVTF